MIDATNTDALRYALITSLRRQIELANMMQDQLSEMVEPAERDTSPLCNLVELVVTLTNDALDQAEQIAWPCSRGF